MQNAVRNLVLPTVFALLAGAAAQAQTSGHIHYEGTQRTDPSQVRVVVNGQVVKPGSPDYPTDIPESRSFALTLAFAGTAAREERENGGAVVRTVENGPGLSGAPQTRSIPRPFQEATFLDLTNRSSTTVLTVKQDEGSTTYRTDTPIAAASGWNVTNQTRKIAGYTCRKATVPYKKETYTVWFTTELPFTYSPMHDLTPDKGVVLALESDQQHYRAAKIDLKAVAETDVQPSATAQKVTPAELKDLREKAMADFRQKLIETNETSGNSN